MKVRIARSIKAPTLYAYFISDFNEITLDHFKSRKPFTSYHRELKEYEVTEEIYKEVATENDLIVDERIDMPLFERVCNEKYGYQRDAVLFANRVDNLLLNFSQGTGKSKTTMMIIENKQFVKTLIICGQSNLQEEWIKDARKHGYADKYNFRIIGDSTDASGTKKVRWIESNIKNSGVDLINIEALRNVKVLAALNKANYDCLVIDEVQSAKGWKAQQTEGLHSLKDRPNQVRIALSGTPVLNNPLEFFSVLKFLKQLNKTARTTYERYYGVFGFNYWGHFVNRGFKNLDKLQELLKPVIAYIGKDELSLPKKTRNVINLEKPKTDEIKDLERLYKLSTSRLRGTGYTSKAQIKARMQLLTSTVDCKLDYIIEKSADAKLLVFSQWVRALKIVEEELILVGKKVLLYSGELNMKERLDILEKWRTGEYDILLLSVMSARYGLNLTEATDVIFLEPPVSLSVLEQAEDRSHRIGQTLPVTSHILLWGEYDLDRYNSIMEKQESINKVYSFLE